MYQSTLLIHLTVGWLGSCFALDMQYGDLASMEFLTLLMQ